MELIQIIYDILLFGAVLLIIVIISSFVISRNRKEEEVKKDLFPVREKKAVKELPKFQSAHTQIQNVKYGVREEHSKNSPQIFQIDRYKPREIKIVRKQTFTSHESEKLRAKENVQLRKTEGRGFRYTIVNDSHTEQDSKAIQYYY